MTRDDDYLPLVREHLDHVLSLARPPAEPSPLLVDGVCVETGEPIVWRLEGRQMHVANVANQNSLMRALVGLSELTGEPGYRETAQQAVRFTFDRLADRHGLLYWGHHVAYDPRGDVVFGHHRERLYHELKTNYPFYELMWDVDARATRRYVEALWDAHIHDFATLDMNRHGRYERDTPVQPDGDVWQREYVGGEAFFHGSGLSFLSAGTDFIFAAAMLASLSGDDAPLTWANRLVQRYEQTRHPDTQLTGYQFSQYEQDRAQKQFGPELGPYALEGTILTAGHYHVCYALAPLSQLMLAERLGARGGALREHAVRNLLAFCARGYDRERNVVIPMLTDGRRLSPDDVKRPGYYKPGSLEPRPAGALFLRAAATAHRITGEPRLWQLTADVARGMGLGDWRSIDAPPTDIAIDHDDPHTIFAMLELRRASGHRGWVDLAHRVAQCMIANRYHHRLFLDAPDHLYAKFDRREPVALLHLAAAERGLLERMPVDRAGSAFFCGDHDDATNRFGRLMDDELFYHRRSGKKVEQ